MGPDDHDPARSLSGHRGCRQACGLARRSAGECGVFHSHAALHQSPVQLWQLLLVISADLQTPPQGEGIGTLLLFTNSYRFSVSHLFPSFFSFRHTQHHAESCQLCPCPLFLSSTSSTFSTTQTLDLLSSSSSLTS